LNGIANRVITQAVQHAVQQIITNRQPVKIQPQAAPTNSTNSQIPQQAQQSSQTIASTGNQNTTTSSMLQPPGDFRDPSGTPVRYYQLPGNTGWRDTGIDITNGQFISIATDGTFTIESNSPYATPAGFVASAGVGNTIYGKLQPQRFEWQINASGTPFVIPYSKERGNIGGISFEFGTRTNFVASTSGRLFLTISDNHFAANLAEWTVVVCGGSGNLSSQPAPLPPQTPQNAGQPVPSGGIQNTNQLLFTTLYSFTGGSDGASPSGKLILSGNTLYGTAGAGGGSSNGVVFKLNVDGTGFSILHNFTATTKGKNTDGKTPGRAGLILSGKTLYGTTADGGAQGLGVVFAINTDGTHFINLHNFNINLPVIEGAGSIGDLTLSGNTLFGTATGGGSFYKNEGTLFRVNIDGTGFTNLLNFTGDNGSHPMAGLILSGNTLYGTTEGGGDNDQGTVFSVNTDGSNHRILHSFTALDNGNNDGATPQADLILSGNTIYGTAAGGGRTENGSTSGGAVFSMNADGSGFTILHTFNDIPPSNIDGSSPLAGLVLSGNALYGTTGFGGNSFNGIVFSINTDGSNYMILHSFNGSDGGGPVADLTLSDNTLYGTTTKGGAYGKGTIFRITGIGGGTGSSQPIQTSETDRIGILGSTPSTPITAKQPTPPSSGLFSSTSTDWQSSDSSSGASLETKTAPESAGNGLVDISVKVANITTIKSDGDTLHQGGSFYWILSQDNLSQFETALNTQLASQGIDLKNAKITAMVSTGNLVDPATVNNLISWIGVLSLPGNISTASDAATAAPNALEAVGLYYVAEYIQGDPTKIFQNLTTTEWNIINQSVYLADQTSAQTLFSAAQQSGVTTPTFVIVPGQALDIEISGAQYTGKAQTMSITAPFNFFQSPSSVTTSGGVSRSVSLTLSIEFTAGTTSSATPVVQSVVLSQATVAVNGTFQVTVTVKNTGGTAGNFDVQLADTAWVSGWQVLTPAFQNQAFTAGQSQPFTFNVKATSAGQHAFNSQARINGHWVWDGSSIQSANVTATSSNK
jgi:uncharacterized repeat protein (TIGR03803 family)